MKIVRIETLWLYAVPQAEWQAAQGALRQALPNNLWVQIVTDDGRVGLGETYYVPRAVAAIDDRGSRRLRSMSMSELKIYVGGAAALRGVHRRGAPPDLHGGRDGAVAFGRQQAGNRAGGRHGRDRSGFVGAWLGGAPPAGCPFRHDPQATAVPRLSQVSPKRGAVPAASVPLGIQPLRPMVERGFAGPEHVVAGPGQIAGAVNGPSLVTRTPSGASASVTAPAIAPTEPVVPPSPAPFMPNGLR